jgi:hypothetical protein
MKQRIPTNKEGGFVAGINDCNRDGVIRHASWRL